MNCIGFDLGKVHSQVCIITSDGELLEHRLKTDRESLTKLLGVCTRSRILVEAGTESEWVARHLEQLGHEIIVADPNFAPMYATRSRRVKTDKRDARTLAEACRLGAYRPAHRTSDTQRHVRAKLAVREAIVRTRSKYISLIRALLRRDGLRVAAGTARSFAVRIECLPLSAELSEEVAPLVRLLESVNEQLKLADDELAQLVKDDPVVKRLTSAPGVGPVTAACFVATLDDVTRFPDAKQARAYLGLVPSEYSSGERQQRGRINKAGPNRARYLMVEAAWALLRSTGPEGAALRQWAAGIRERRGTKVAIVALARKLAGILYAMWRDATDFAPPLQHREVVAACTGA
ncbi:MAG: IS110 family transposase [Acidobacteriota bacterium]|nr:IS110 family transposase [Acidobacteriota bacterium]